MGIHSNLHTHTKYCDGMNTALEMAEAAYQKGFRSLGFSGHSYTPFDERYCMSIEGEKEYREEVLQLKKQFEGRMDIFLGLENDGAIPTSTEGYEYIIGSVHYLPVNGRYYGIDESPALLRLCIEEGFSGNALAMARAYYDMLVAYVKAGDVDIVGHLDLIEKFDLQHNIMPSSSPAYRRMALEAADEIVNSGKIIEINTGAIARGFRDTPYPAKHIIEHLVMKKAPIILSSDAHSANGINAYFLQTADMLKSLGCKEVMELRRGEAFVPIPL